MYFVGHGGAPSDGTLVSPDLPPALAGDLLFLHVVQKGNNNAITVSAGWTLLERLQVSTTLVVHLYYRFYVVGDAAPDVNSAGAGDTVKAIVCGVNGVDPTMANPSTFATFGTASGTANSITLAAAAQPQPGDRLLAFVGTKASALGGLDLAVNGQYQGYEGSDYVQLFMAWTDLPLNADRTITCQLISGASLVDYGAIFFTVPAEDGTVTPSLGSQEEVYRQPPLLGTGASFGPKADGRPVVVVQVLDPGPADDASVWDVNYWSTPTWGGPGRWHNVETRVRGISWSRGAPDPLSKPTVGQAAITLSNLDGQASPWATSGEFVDGSGGSVPANAPTITLLSPATGSTAGGTSVEITGTNLDTVTTLKIDGVSVAFTHTGGGGHKLTFTTPAHAAGAVQVVATNPNGSSPTGTASALTYGTGGSGYGSGPYGSGPYGDGG